METSSLEYRDLKSELPCVAVLATGGTIAGSAESSAQAGYRSGMVDVEAMIQSLPELEKIARVRGEQIANVGSQDMSFEIMARLSRRINDLLSGDDIHGVVVTHGTDTLEETAYFLNLTVKSPKTVVMTGAMRPATAISADGPLNLFNAVAVAADPQAREKGVLVVMNDRIHGAHSLTKSNTTSVETFISPINGLMGTVNYGKTTYFRAPSRRHTFLSEFSFEFDLPLPRVDIVYACADMPPDLIECSVIKGARGIVIAGDGNGNMNDVSVKMAASMAENGIWIVRSSRVPTGRVGRNVEVDDDANQFIASDELNPAKSRILLMLALLKNPTHDQVQDLFYAY
ncbi:asparaginase [Desulfospira joergensenii]|uniref:asparaginase n=1 Tax=Desulfospira joergensenii TaxID=53329 RepID=UPI0003B7634B|nr:asparaginase [Desulfospira joergensenii]